MVYSKRGMVVRVIYLIVSMVYYTLQRLGILQKSGLLTLCYHGVKHDQSVNFLDQMKYLSGLVVSTNQTAQTHGGRGLSICLTFDDAFENLLENVIPLVSKFKIPITIFIPTSCLGNIPCWLDGVHADSNEKIMTSEQLHSLSKNPLVTLGSHTVSHQRLSLLEPLEIRQEFNDSKKDIEDIIKNKVDQLAFPHGDYNDEVVDLALEAGYRSVYTLSPVIHNGDGNVIGRFSMSPDVWPIEFMLTVKGAYSWLFPWRSFLKKFR